MRILLVIFFLISALLASAQQKVLVYLKDKGPDAPALLQNPEKFLSASAIERRLICNVPFDNLDIPVYNNYLTTIQNIPCQVLSTSKWLNAAMVLTTASNFNRLLQLPFVDSIVVYDTYATSLKNTTATNSILDYGYSSTQIKMLNLDQLHDQGYTGNHVLVSVCDGGFYGVNSIGAFQYIRSKGRIKATRDFVNNDGDVYADDLHGAHVFSIMAGKIDAGLIGSAFDADYMLARTENVSSETHAEEYNWLLASEWADSAGARIIQSSLGYNNFDAGGNYTQANMDGRTAIITKAAVIATRKGIVIVNSAGNEGDQSFKKITAPSDADSILCVGSVDANGNRVSNSGQGPSGDGRIKPDVMAMGGNTAYVSSSNTVAFGTGTSYAAPLIAGLCACLYQKYPFVTNMELITAVKRSANKYNTPDTFYGYGIPNAYIADTILKNVSVGRGIINYTKGLDQIIRNTFCKDILELNIETAKPVMAEVYNSSGSLVQHTYIDENKIDVHQLASGNYYLKLDGRYAGKFFKEGIK